MPDAAQARARRIRHRRDRDDAAAVSKTRAHARHSRRQLSHPLAGEFPGGEQARGLMRPPTKRHLGAGHYCFDGSSLNDAKKFFTSSAASAFSFFGMPAANWIG